MVLAAEMKEKNEKELGKKLMEVKHALSKQAFARNNFAPDGNIHASQISRKSLLRYVAFAKYYYVSTPLTNLWRAQIVHASVVRVSGAPFMPSWVEIVDVLMTCSKDLELLKKTS